MDLANNIQKGDWFITITLKPIIYNRRARHQYVKSIESVINVLNIFCERYILVPELTEACNIHYHATACFKKTMEFAKERFIDVCKIHRIIGNTKVNKMPIDDIQRTANYIEKDYNKTKAVLKLKRDEDAEFYHIKTHEKPAVKIDKKYLDIDI